MRRTERVQTEPIEEDAIAPGWGEDRARLRTIPLSGGAVSVYGREVAYGAQVNVLGEIIPVDNEGGFIIDRILPAGQHDVVIKVDAPTGETLKFQRSVAVPDSDWFYVALADLTLGARSPSARVEAVRDDGFTETFAKGQAQFYLKGKIKGEYLLTASGDTGEGPLSEMFQGVLSKDPRAVLSRIDPNDYYPVYGDDSELVEDAPTRGKLYVRLERGQSNVMWGTFRTEIGNSAFYRDDRMLYGAAGTYKSEDVTPAGQHRVRVNLHAAYPGTVSQRDVLRGSGGSAYFLHRQDILPDSETLTVEVRDGVTGTVRTRRALVRGTDYRVNYMQGLVILTTPLASASDPNSVASAVSDTQYLVVQYEYTPIGLAVDDYALAGAGQAWINDHISVGATAVREDIKGETTTLVGGNLRLQADDKTFVTAEVMRSDGQGSGSWVSTDGGLTFVEESLARRIDPAYAGRVSGELDFSTFGGEGRVGATVEARQQGFAAQGSASKYEQLLVSTFADLRLAENTQLRANLNLLENRGSGHTANVSAEVMQALTEELTLRGGISHLDTVQSKIDGTRTDLGVGIDYVLSDDLEVSAFARKTVARSGTLSDADRIGVGAQYQINEAVALEGEVSYGTTGVGAMVGLVHQPTPDERNYIGYRVNADDSASLAATARTGLVVGTERRINEVVAMHSEAIYNTFARNRTLTQTYGVTLTPDQMWTFNGGFERGNIYDPHDEDIERTALSLGAGYTSDGVTGTMRGELRDEKSSTGKRNGQSILIGSSMSWRTNDDWRLLGNFDGLISHYDNKAILDGDYVEASLGYAYRPVDNERFNALMRYTFLYDLPGAQQVTVNGTTNGPAQRSHIVSIDGNYDINEWLTVGAKYGARIGEVSPDRNPRNFSRSSAHLGIIRVDAEFAKGWDLLLEGRAMVLPEIKTVDFGALAAIYYSVDDHVKIGAGYNFAGFSDDLRDLRKDHQGVFFNVLAKY